MNGMYEQLYELVKGVLFGTSAESYVWAEFISQAISACGCVLLIAIPFIIVWRIIRTLL